MSFPAEQLAALLQRTQQIAEIQKNQELQKESQNDENLSRNSESPRSNPSNQSEQVAVKTFTINLRSSGIIKIVSTKRVHYHGVNFRKIRCNQKLLYLNFQPIEGLKTFSILNNLLLFVILRRHGKNSDIMKLFKTMFHINFCVK